MSKFFGVLGSVLLIAGTFSPVIMSSNTGGISFMEGDAMMWKGIVIIILGIGGIIIYLKNNRDYEKIISLLSLVVVLLFFLVMFMQLSRLSGGGGDAMSRALTNIISLFGGTFTLAWGWLVYAAGVLLMLVGAFRK